MEWLYSIDPGGSKLTMFDAALAACTSKTRATDIVDAVGIGLYHLGRVRGES